MLGILIGVAVVILVVAIGQGATKAVNDQISALGTNLITVRPSPKQIRLTAAGRTATTAAPVNDLKVADANAIAKQFPSTIAAVAPQVRGNVQVRFQGHNISTSVTGATASYQFVNNEPVSQGRWFTDYEDRGNRKVCLVGMTTANNLTGSPNSDLVGQQLVINGDNYDVIGMLASKGAGAFGQDQDDVIIVPITPAMQRLLGVTVINNLSVMCTSTAAMTLAEEQISALLRIRHHLMPPFPANDDFQVTSQTELLARQSSVTDTMTMLLTAIAIISLVVGGIGIMNIMLVSVTERTREIGIRKAIGATPNDILMQFLLESATMSLIGGILGTLVGVGISYIMGKSGWNTIVSSSAIIAAFVVSGGIGIFFGIYPASKASKLHPIEALRYE
jgi:putative ABC transport system permease protein